MKNAARFMNQLSNVCWLLATLWICSGCISTKPHTFAEDVRTWVPLGTPAGQAEAIMTAKGFECHRWTKDNPFNPYGIAYLGCEREQKMLHDWSVRFFLEDDKVVAYGPISIDDITVKP